MPHIDRIGISYMYMGAWAKSGKGGEEFHVGPHLMIVSPHQDEFQGLNRDPSNGMPYVTHLPNRTELTVLQQAGYKDSRDEVSLESDRCCAERMATCEF
jgi:hypothetical protein